MKKQLAVIAMAAMIMMQAGMTAKADEGALTSGGSTAWQVVSFPLRLVTGTAGMALGAVGGGLKGIVHAEETFATNTFGKADENPMLVPVGLVGTVVAVPVGFVTGAPQGAVSGGKYGFGLWDKL